MKREFALACVSAALCFAPPAFATGMFQPDGVSAIDPQGDNGPQKMQLPPDPEGRAVELRLHGQCNQAIPILRSLTYSNSHDDIARYNLGQCLIDVGKANANTQLGLTDEREGAQWMLEAANHGLPNAQAGLISVYLNGDGVARDPVQAGKWSLLYHSNGMRLALGMPDISSDLQARLDAALNARNWDQAQSLADQWSPESQGSAEE